MPLGTPLRRMPIPEEIGEFLTSLLGAAVSVSKARGVDLSDAPEALVCARYLDDTDRLAGACITDLAFAASAGAALAMMPATLVAEALRAGELVESLHENFYEVANIMTRLLNGPSVAHLRITDLVVGMPDDVAALVRTAPGVKHYDVTILGYPGGRASLVAGG
jgi:hypothetical protein